MQYDEMMNALGSISPRYETTLEILSDCIGYEFTVDLLKPFFEYILPKKDICLTILSFLFLQKCHTDCGIISDLFTESCRYYLANII